MRPSRGMGIINPKKLRSIKKRDGDEPVALYSKGGVAKGLWDNIHAKRKRISEGSGEKMRRKGSKGAPTEQALKAAQIKR
jgi:hypothetical protein